MSNNFNYWTLYRGVFQVYITPKPCPLRLLTMRTSTGYFFIFHEPRGKYFWHPINEIGQQLLTKPSLTALAKVNSSFAHGRAQMFISFNHLIININLLKMTICDDPMSVL